MVVSITDKIKFVQSVLGTGRLSRGSTNLDVWCPYCAFSDKQKKKLSIRLEDFAWHCWNCEHKGRSLVALIKKFGNKDQLIDYKNRFATEHVKQYIDTDYVEKPKLKLPEDFTLLALANSSDPDVKAVLRYVSGRGLTERDLWHYKIGISDEPRWRRRVLVPSFDDQGELNYFVGRALDKQRKPKYDNPDTDKLSIVFNHINIDWTQRLVLCEGVFDMFKCGDNAIPLLGSSLNEQSLLFNTIISNSTPVVLALDADMFHKRVYPIAEKLVEYAIDVAILDVRPFADPGTMTKIEFQERLNNACKYSWNDSINNRLFKATHVSLRL